MKQKLLTQEEKLELFWKKELPLGLEIDCPLDNFLRFKYGQLNLLIGVDNVGKTFWKMWYYTCLAVKHNLKFHIFSSENEIWSLKMKIISFYNRKHITKLTKEEYDSSLVWVSQHFYFVDDSKFYTITDLLGIFSNSDADCCLIDPYNSLKVPKGYNKYEYDEEMLGVIRQFCKTHQKTVEINMHCVSEASRRLHTDGMYKGLVMPPEKSHAAGGQIFANRGDDFIILHRYFNSEMRSTTLAFIDKIKEDETGGSRTNYGEPIIFKFSEYGFSVNGINPLTGVVDAIEPIVPIDAYGGLPKQGGLFEEDTVPF